MKYESYSCVNAKCEKYKKCKEGNIDLRSIYGKEKDRELLYCKVCKKTF